MVIWIMGGRVGAMVNIPISPINSNTLYTIVRGIVAGILRTKTVSSIINNYITPIVTTIYTYILPIVTTNYTHITPLIPITTIY